MTTTVVLVAQIGKAPDPRSVALARSLGRAIAEFNERTPGGRRIKIDSNLSRVLALDPSRPKSKLAKGVRATENPGVLYVMDLAQQLGTTVGALLGETERPITSADRERANEMIDWLSEAFQLEREKAESAEDNVLPFVPFRPKIVEEGAYTFPIPPASFQEHDFDYPQPWHYWTTDEPVEELPAAAAGPQGVPNMLNPRGANVREVIDRLNQIVRVIGDSMEDRYFHGDLIRVDTQNRNPLVGDPIAVYCEDLGGSLLGFYRRDGDRVCLVKKNKPKYDDVLLPEAGWVLLGKIESLVDRVERRERL